MSETRSEVDGKLTTYEDDGALVVCDVGNPKAWIRSDIVIDAEEFERGRPLPKSGRR